MRDADAGDAGVARALRERRRLALRSRNQGMHFYLGVPIQAWYLREWEARLGGGRYRAEPVGGSGQVGRVERDVRTGR